MSKQDLSPYRPDHKELAAKGGRNAAKTNRRRRALRELLEIALAEKDGDMDKAMKITIALIEKAIDGDVNAYKTILEVVGEKPKEQVEISTANTIEINITDENKT